MAENEPHYQTRPFTLDPNREIDEDAPPAAGQTEQDAELVRELDENLTSVVDEEAEAEQKRAEDRAESGDPTPSQFARGARSRKEGEQLDKQQEKENGQESKSSSSKAQKKGN